MAERSDHGARHNGGPVREGTLAGDFSDLCVRLAGALAEAGIAAIEVRRPGEQPLRLGARVTDLPGMLSAAPAGTEFEARAGGPSRGRWIAWVVEPKQIRWRSDDPMLIAALGK